MNERSRYEAQESHSYTTACLQTVFMTVTLFISEGYIIYSARENCVAGCVRFIASPSTDRRQQNRCVNALTRRPFLRAVPPYRASRAVLFIDSVLRRAMQYYHKTSCNGLHLSSLISLPSVIVRRSLVVFAIIMDQRSRGTNAWHFR